jgi:hypothetical protein|tara:strand:+ start:30 stop:443 length:414 start_codon:yes stop_codon:yes gene_type:complete
MIKLEKVNYYKLSSREKENYNYAKISSSLSEYGFQTIKLSDDWQTADFIAQHIDKKTFLKVQLKSRLSIDKKYLNKDIWICFREKNFIYLYPHDKTCEFIKNNTNIKNTESWKKRGHYYWPKIPKNLMSFLNKYKFK